MNAQVTIIEPETLEYLPAKTLLTLVERQQKAQKNFALFKQTVGALPDMFRAFEGLDLDVGFNLLEDYISVQFAGDGPKLTAVWKLLRQNGYSTYARPKKGDTTFYAFWEREGSGRIFLNFSSTMCRRVQVGTKMVEQPIYETQCGELTTADLEIEAPKHAVVEADDEIPF